MSNPYSARLDRMTDAEIAEEHDYLKGREAIDAFRFANAPKAPPRDWTTAIDDVLIEADMQRIYGDGA